MDNINSKKIHNIKLSFSLIRINPHYDKRKKSVFFFSEGGGGEGCSRKNSLFHQFPSGIVDQWKNCRNICPK